MRSHLTAAFILAAALATGCTATVATPDLVYVSPGVQVIADYDQPIFYSDGFYWWNTGGLWYRSTYYTGGWVVAQPPVAVMRIDRPHSYVRYRPAGWAGHPRTAPPPRSSGGWRGSPPPQPAPAQSGWRGAPQQPHAAPAPAARPASPPAHTPPPAHKGGGWRGH